MWIFGLIEDFCPSMMSTKNQSQFYYFLGIFAGKIGIKPERSPVARLRICFFVLSMVTPMELINRGEQAPAPSHWSPKHPFLSKQKVGWPKVGRSLWQQLKRKRLDSGGRSCVSLLSIFLGFLNSTLGQNPTFCPEITSNLMIEKCEFCEKWGYENVNFAKNEIP